GPCRARGDGGLVLALRGRGVGGGLDRGLPDRPMSSQGPDHETLPAPTVWPMVVALGLTLAMAALVTHAVVGIVGLALAVIGGTGWWFQVLPQEQVEHVPLRPLAERPAAVVAVSTPVERLLL